MSWRDKALGPYNRSATLKVEGEEANLPWQRPAEMPVLIAPLDDGWFRFKLGSHLDAARIREDGIEVRFRGRYGSSVYFYPAKAEHFEKLCAAEHPGEYLHKHIRG